MSSPPPPPPSLLARLKALLASPSPRAALAVLVALLASVAVVVTVSDDPSQPGHQKTTVTVTLGGPGHKSVALTPQAQAIAKTQTTKAADGSPTVEADLHESTVPSPTAAAQAQDLKPAGQPTIPSSVTQAAASQPGCTTSLVRNYSSRRGAPVLLGVIHWTGSTPTASSAGGLAIVHWFDTPAAQASSSEITDQAGRCWLTVPESQKAWTQAGFNPWSVSVEITNAGVQPLFQTAAARAAVVRLMRGWHARWKLPYRRAQVSGCRVVRSGFLSHKDLGACGGGHPDVGSFDMDGLIREAAKSPAAKPVSSSAKAWCRKLTWWRTHGRPHGKAEANAVVRRGLLAKHRVACSAKGVATAA